MTAARCSARSMADSSSAPSCRPAKASGPPSGCCRSTTSTAPGRHPAKSTSSKLARPGAETRCSAHSALRLPLAAECRGKHVGRLPDKGNDRRFPTSYALGNGGARRMRLGTWTIGSSRRSPFGGAASWTGPRARPQSGSPISIRGPRPFGPAVLPHYERCRRRQVPGQSGQGGRVPVEMGKWITFASLRQGRRLRCGEAARRWGSCRSH